MDGPVVGIDLGGTKIFGAVVDGAASDAPAVVRDAKVATPTTSAADIIDAVVEMVRSLHDDPVAVGVGSPGVVEPVSGVVQRAPNLAGFDRPVPLGTILAERLGIPVTVANDVNVAAFGEVMMGVAQGHRDVLAVWMGTGLGGGLVLDGRLRAGPSGLAGELGHVVVVPNGRPCPCGGLGHVEAYIGRRAMEDRARELHGRGRTTALVELAGDGRMKSKAFATAYAEGDDVAVELIDEGLSLLGVAVANVVVTVDVAAIVVGGGLGERLDSIAIDGLERSLRALRFSGVSPVVLGATLGDPAGAIGAAVLAARPVA